MAILGILGDFQNSYKRLSSIALISKVDLSTYVGAFVELQQQKLEAGLANLTGPRQFLTLLLVTFPGVSLMWRFLSVAEK